jgi:putative aldouronate transport system permease protein
VVTTVARPAATKAGATKKVRPRGVQDSLGYRVFQVVNGIILTGVVVVTLLPFANVISRSFSSERYIDAGKVTLWPRGFNITTYRRVLTDHLFWRNYENTVLYTVSATAVALALTTCYAYVLSKKQLKGRSVLIAIPLITMFFTGGLIPNYVLVNSLGLRNTIGAIILPNAINVFYLLVMKAFFESLPVELEEAAAVDGANTYRTLWSVVLPLSKAVLATMLLFYAVLFWNSWFTAFLYMDKQEYFPATVYLRNMVVGATTGSDNSSTSDFSLQVGANIRAVTVVLTAAPIMLVYPFIQRYFVSGVMLGAVKG